VIVRCARAISPASHRGEEGAHQVRNDSDTVARFAMPSSWTEGGYVAIRPDSNTALIVGPGFRRIVPLDEDLG